MIILEALNTKNQSFSIKETYKFHILKPLQVNTGINISDLFISNSLDIVFLQLSRNMGRTSKQVVIMQLTVNIMIISNNLIVKRGMASLSTLRGQLDYRNLKKGHF